MPTALDYARELIEFDSVSSRSNLAVSDCVADWLKKLHFEIERVNYTDPNGVLKSNVIGKLGSGSGGMAYFAHTDVVPAANWKFTEHGPFNPVVRDGLLYGRGSTDMKGSIACALAAISDFSNSTPRFPVYVCCTADEEVGMLGAAEVQRNSQMFREIVSGESRSIVGEPTQLEVIHGHKGGCGIRMTARGVAAHSSSRKGISANWKMIPFLTAIRELNDELETDPAWRNDRFDPPTMTMNLNVCDGNAAMNVTAARSVCALYFRAMPGLEIGPVIERIRTLAQDNGLEFEQVFRATPFYRDPDSTFVQECLEFSPNKVPHTVAYGTDAAFFHELKNCVVMGPGDIAQAHTHDEWVRLTDLEAGTTAYRKMLSRWCF